MTDFETKSAFTCSLINKGVIIFLSVISIVGISAAPQIFGISMFISIITLILTCLSVGIIISDWHKQIPSMPVFHNVLLTDELKWYHIQYTVSIILSIFNLLSFFLLATLSQLILFGGAYFISCTTTLIIFFMYVFEATVSLRMSTDESIFVAEEYQEIS